MKRKPTPKKKHAGGRPRGITMPCGWCNKPMTATEMRTHFTECPARVLRIKAIDEESAKDKL